MKTTLGLLSVLLFSSLLSAQVILNAELRPRLEYRHGFKTLYGAARQITLRHCFFKKQF